MGTVWLNDEVLDSQERIGYRLRELYQEHGFVRYQMSKFEEYDLYSRNRDFLLSENVITFTNPDGRLMALKPDVTLSIVKNMKDLPQGVRKLYYHEHVYRVTEAEEGFREQAQVGLECMGRIDGDCVAEVLRLAQESLALCSGKYVLEISHLGILRELTEAAAGGNALLRDALLHCVSEKNAHHLSELCREAGVAAEQEERLVRLIQLYGAPEKVLPGLRALSASAETGKMIDELAGAVAGADAGHLLIDFSATEDLKYYNGIAMKGFIEGIPGSVLSGGRYDGLMRRMGRKDHAIGFAVFLNRLERLQGGDGHA